MIYIQQLKIQTAYTEDMLLGRIARHLGIDKSRISSYEILRRSIDARRKPEIFYVMSLHVSCPNEAVIVKKCRQKDVSIVSPRNYLFPASGNRQLNNPPIIIGSGPAGLFCAYQLAKHGYAPIVLERGEDVDSRLRSVEHFWTNGVINPESNVQFGEGGAGTFSDGKLNTLNKDTTGRNREVLGIFVHMGAKEDILYDQKPHLGTDRLALIVKNLRNEILRLGGEVRFCSKVTKLVMDEQHSICAVVVNDQETIPANVVVLAPGHSARDTFEMLYQIGIPMEPKDFAVGYRVMHPQDMINESQYGVKDPATLHLGAAPYKLTAQTSGKRGVYSFCMCPGGYVVNASSREGQLVINGMSYSGRDSDTANSAIIVTVRQSDFEEEGVLAGVHFQQKIEEAAYKIGQGKIPLQLYGDFKNGTISSGFGNFEPCTKGTYQFANVRKILPETLNMSFIEGMEQFGHKIRGFDREDVIVCGVESRTSSPLRIRRDARTLQSDVRGLYPCGEGAGYAGGITSAAADGIYVAEKIAMEYAPVAVPDSNTGKPGSLQEF